MTGALSLPSVPPAKGDVVLREFHSDDVPMLRDLATDPYVAQTGSLPGGATEQEALAYIARQRLRLSTATGYPFCIALASDGSAVGTIGLWLDPSEPRVVTAGYSVAPRHRGRGYARSALQALMDVAGELTEAGRVDLHIEPSNPASVRVAETAGFTLVGSVLHPRTSGGSPVEMLLYSRSVDRRRDVLGETIRRF